MINKNAVRAVFEGSLKLKKGEACLIVTDTIKEEIARAFYEFAKTISGKSRIIVMEPTVEHGAEPPDDVARQMLGYDVEILVTEKSLTHTRARRRATASGARIATMPSITEEIANRCLDVDYEKLKNDSTRLYNILKGSREVRVVTRLGTDITFLVGESEFFGREGGLFDSPGAYGNLPEGEISFSPRGCAGTYVVDASFPGLGLLNAPLTFKVTEGIVREVTGERSGEVTARLNAAGPAAWRVAELGIGLNPKAVITGNILEDEKVIGTAHIAVGNNLSYSGNNDVPLHLDGVITKPDIYVDGEKLMGRGEFVGKFSVGHL